MTVKNKYFLRSRISEPKFREIVGLFFSRSASPCRLNPFLRRQNKGIASSRIFKDIEFDTVKIRIIDFLPKSQKFNFIEKGKFWTANFSKTERINPRTVERDILFLRDKKLIIFKGHSKFGKYQVTAKYKKLKKAIK